jgi:hypothetical protein
LIYLVVQLSAFLTISDKVVSQAKKSRCPSCAFGRL